MRALLAVAVAVVTGAGAQTSAPPPSPSPLTLPQLQELARKNDPRTGMARAQLEGAHGKRDETYWAWFPDFKTQIGFGGPTPEMRLNHTPGPQTDPAGNLVPHPTSLLDVTPGSRCWFCGTLGVGIASSVSITLPIYTFGKLQNGKSAADHLVGAMTALLQKASDQATFDVTRAYWGYQTARGAHDSVVDVRKKLGEAKKRAQKLLAEESDQVTKSDAMKLDYLAEEIEAQTAGAEKGAALAFIAIRLLIGAGPDDNIVIAEEKLPPPPAQPDEEQVVRRALTTRPEARAALEQVGARRALVEVEKAKLYPDFAIVGGATLNITTSAESPNTVFAYNPYNTQSAFVALGLQATFDIPQKLARVRQAEAQLNDALAQQRGAEQLVRLELRQALGDLQEARVRAERYTNQAAIGKQLAVQASLSFDSGLGDARELLEGTLLWQRAEGERFKALFDAQIAWASVQKASGGL
ncbi:MAG: TolC family protein [Myxococcales bacterium]